MFRAGEPYPGRFDSRTKLSETSAVDPVIGLEKRDRFVSELREAAKARGLSFRVTKTRGKGGHAMVWVGERVATLPSREIDPKTASKIRKQLGLS